MGRILRTQAAEWHVLRLPVIAEADDPLGRAEGEPLWNDDLAYGFGQRLLELREQHERDGLTYEWASLYECRPRPPSGAMSRPGEMRIVEVLPPKLWHTVRG